MYEPKPSHSAILLILGCGALYCTRWTDWAYFPGLGMVILSILVIHWTDMGMVIQKRHAEAEWFKSLSGMDPTQWQALGLLNIPHINVTWQGAIVELFEGIVPMEQFKHFMETSNSGQTSPERDWCTKEHPKRYWLSIYGWLEKNRMVISASAAGSHSFRWYPGKWEMLWDRYMQHKIANLQSPGDITPYSAQIYEKTTITPNL